MTTCTVTSMTPSLWPLLERAPERSAAVVSGAPAAAELQVRLARQHFSSDRREASLLRSLHRRSRAWQRERGAASHHLLKTAVDAAGQTRHTVYIQDTIELRSTTWKGTDYVLSAANTML